MRDKVIILIALLVILVIILFCTRVWTKEGFNTSIMDNVQDRANPLAAPIHPLYNPNAKYGISESSGADLRTLNLAALNTVIEQRTDTSDLTQKNKTVRLSPRLDNENSFLGMVKFCKETAEDAANQNPPKNPFNNPTFKEHCGVCTGSGSYITGETFNRLSNNGRGAGVLVYKEDKNRAMAKQTRNNYRYPRAIPSLDAAQCEGASLNDDSQVPSLAINSKMYYDMLKRQECINNKAFSTNHTCGRCVTGGDDQTWSFVKNPEGTLETRFADNMSIETNANVNPIYLDLYGVGQVKVMVKDKPIRDAQNKHIDYQDLSLETPLTVDLSRTDLGYAKEGEQFTVSLKAVNNGIAYVGGMLRGNAPPGGVESKLQLANVYNKDRLTGVRTSRGPRVATKTDEIITFVPSTGSGDPDRDVEVLLMECFIPLTFISTSWDNDHPQIAYYDCQNNPYVTSELSEALLIDDACIRDVRLHNELSAECLQNLLADEDIKCSSAGDWWRNPNLLKADGGTTPADIKAYLRRVVPTASTNQSINKKCFGIDTSNPCDPYIGTEAEPSRECLASLYSNQITENKRLVEAGRATVYSTEGFFDVPKNYRSMNLNTDEFCRPEGKLNPNTDQGYAELVSRAKGYKGLKGVDAVKKYLTDTYDKAINPSLDITKTGEGGRKDAWDACFGIPIAPPKEITKSIDAPRELRRTENVSFSVSCPPTPGYPVFVDPSVKVGSGVTWGGVFINNKPPESENCYWIWGEENYKIIGTTEKYYTFYYNFCNPYGYDLKAKLIGGFDDEGIVTINGNHIITAAASIQTKDPINITLKGGVDNGQQPTDAIHRIEVKCINHGGPAGIWLAIYIEEENGDKTYLVVTNNKWTYTS